MDERGGLGTLTLPARPRLQWRSVLVEQRVRARAAATGGRADVLRVRRAQVAAANAILQRARLADPAFAAAVDRRIPDFPYLATARPGSPAAWTPAGWSWRVADHDPDLLQLVQLLDDAPTALRRDPGSLRARRNAVYETVEARTTIARLPGSSGLAVPGRGAGTGAAVPVPGGRGGAGGARRGGTSAAPGDVAQGVGPAALGAAQTLRDLAGPPGTRRPGARGPAARRARRAQQPRRRRMGALAGRRGRPLLPARRRGRGDRPRRRRLGRARDTAKWARKQARRKALDAFLMSISSGWLTWRRLKLLVAASAALWLALIVLILLAGIVVADAARDIPLIGSLFGSDEAGGQASGAVGADIPYADAFNAAGAETGVDPRLIAAVAWVESSFNPDVVGCRQHSDDRDRPRAQGIMQFMPSTAAGFGINPCDPVQAIHGGARYLAQLFEQSKQLRPGGSWDLALAGYNAGWGAVTQYGGIPPFPETQGYVPKVMGKWEEYKQRYPSGTLSPGGTGGLATVRGITVDSSIATNLEAMLAAAGQDGVTLTGSGYRTYEDQVELRKRHCGTSDYAIYEMPSRQCDPDTARPGTSMHESGLAIDFDGCGSGSPCFQWLSANAARYGFFNLPSEPWHWSVNGS